MVRMKHLGSVTVASVTALGLLTGCGAFAKKKHTAEESIAIMESVEEASQTEATKAEDANNKRAGEIVDAMSDAAAGALGGRLATKLPIGGKAAPAGLDGYCRATVKATIHKEGLMLEPGQEYLVSTSPFGYTSLLVERVPGSFEEIRLEKDQWSSSCKTDAIIYSKSKNVFITEAILSTSQNWALSDKCTIPAGTVLTGDQRSEYSSWTGAKLTAKSLETYCGTDTVYSLSEMPLFHLVPVAG